MLWASDIAMLTPDLARSLTQSGRAHVPSFLDPSAARALRAATKSIEWSFFTNQGGDTRTLSEAELGGEQEAALMQRLYTEATHNFRFAFDSFALSDACLSKQLTSGLLHDFLLSLNAPEAITLFRAFTADQRVAYLDAIVMRCRPGHFVTAHRGGEDALFGYVFDLTPPWRAEWGGLTSFLTEDDHVAEAKTPRMGALSIFRADALHSVSMVAPFAPGARLAIAGWMCAKRPSAKQS